MAPDMTIRWQDQNVIKKDGQWTVDGRPNATVKPVFNKSPSNTPHHHLLSLLVTFPPGGATPPHTHGGAAIIATVTRGRVLNQTVCPDEDPDGQGSGPKIYGVGESWYEPPGCHHVRSENAGDEEAEFVAVFVVEKTTVEKGGLGSLVVIDAAVEEERQQKSGGGGKM